MKPQYSGILKPRDYEGSARRKLALLFLLFLSLALAGCAREGSPGGAEKGPPAETGPGSRLPGGMHLTLQTDKPSYARGEPVKITAALVNLSRKEQDYTLWNLGDPRIYVYVSGTVLKERVPVEEEALRQRVRLPAVSYSTLIPNEIITREFSWDQKVVGPDGKETALPPGSYKLEAVVYLGRMSKESPDREKQIQEVTATEKIEIRP